MNILYFDCFSGISGDMTIGAFLSAGVEFEYLKQELSKLKISGYSLKMENVMKNGLASVKFNVLDSEGNIFGHAPLFAHCKEGISHGHIHGLPHEHYHGGGHSHSHHHENRSEHESGSEHSHFEHIHDEDGCDVHHTHGHNHDHDHNGGAGHSHYIGHNSDCGHKHLHDDEHAGHSHRGLNEIKDIIINSTISERSKKIAIEIFENIAAAESKMHNIPMNEIHFHEVGAIDSIIDIVGTAICIDKLDITECYVSKIPISFGYLKFSHGLWPNPAPAALELLKSFTLYKMKINSELVTPTGAAILKTLCKGSSEMPELELEQIGYGAGYHNFEHPNVLRIMVGKKKL